VDLIIFHVLFSVFSPYSRSYSVHFSFSKFFSVSCHIPSPKVCIYHFPRFSLFLSIFQVLMFAFLILHNFQFSYHLPGPTVSISHFPCFPCFLPYSRSFSVMFCFPFFQFSHHIPGSTVFISHFTCFHFFLTYSKS
jgi:hypothetical protein